MRLQLEEIKLKGEKIEWRSIWSIFHFLIEKIILFKWQYFKNNPRANFLIIKSGLSTFFIFILILISSFLPNYINDSSYKKFLEMILNPMNTIEFFGGFFGSLSIIYWNSSRLYHKKWRYCCDLYNKIIEMDHELLQREILINALAIDILAVDLWAHHSFKEVFADEIVESIKESNYCESEKENLHEKSRRGLLNEIEARNLLRSRQNALLKENNSDEDCCSCPWYHK